MEIFVCLGHLYSQCLEQCWHTVGSLWISVEGVYGVPEFWVPPRIIYFNPHICSIKWRVLLSGLLDRWGNGGSQRWSLFPEDAQLKQSFDTKFGQLAPERNWVLNTEMWLHLLRGQWSREGISAMEQHSTSARAGAGHVVGARGVPSLWEVM